MLNYINFAICYSLNGIQVEFGLTKKFFKIGSDFFLIVRKIIKKRGFTSDPLIERYLENFFLIGDVTNEFVLINIKNIINKSCILRNAEFNEVFRSRCTELNEHN